MDYNFAFSYVEIVSGENNEKVSYSVAVILGDSFMLIPVTAATLEQLQGMLYAMASSFDKKELLTRIVLNEDESGAKIIETSKNPLYKKPEEA